MKKILLNVFHHLKSTFNCYIRYSIKYLLWTTKRLNFSWLMQLDLIVKMKQNILNWGCERAEITFYPWQFILVWWEQRGSTDSCKARPGLHWNSTLSLPAHCCISLPLSSWPPVFLSLLQHMSFEFPKTKPKQPPKKHNKPTPRNTAQTKTHTKHFTRNIIVIDL